jgi:hypothetical protein
MNRRLGSLIPLLAVALTGATPGPANLSATIDAADSAYARGDYVLAEELYGNAEPRSPDPGRVALGLATAKYRLALGGPGRTATLLAEAEELYRCCLALDDSRRSEALVGLGNCLLRDAGNRDAGAAWSAAEQFAEARREPGGTELVETARHNLQRARLLARQIPTAPPEPPEKPPSDDPERDRKPPEGAPRPQDLSDENGGKRAGARPEAADSGQPSTTEDEARSPGKGELPPVPDQDGQPPLTPPQAREHLEQAARRIMEEGRHHRRGAARAPAPGVRDW